MIPPIVRSPAVLAGIACLVLAGCGTRVYAPLSTATRSTAPDSSHASSAAASQAQSLRSLESERSRVARQYWPATSVVMKAVPAMEARLGIRLRFEEAFGTFTSCGPAGLQYQVVVIISASGHLYQDLGPPLGQAARIAEHALTAEGWGPFGVPNGIWVAAEHDGVSASFDNDPSATESEASSATDLLYFLAGACVAVPGSASAAPGGGSQAGGGPDAGPPPGDVSAGDGLPPVRDSYGLGPATVPPLAQMTGGGPQS